MKYLLDTNVPVYLEDPDSPFHHSMKEKKGAIQEKHQCGTMTEASYYRLTMCGENY